MSLIGDAGRMLIQKGVQKAGQSGVKSLLTKIPLDKNKPQTQPGEGLSFGGTTTQTFVENRQRQIESDIRSLPKDYLKSDIKTSLNQYDEEDDIIPFKGFKGIESKSLIDATKVAQFKDDVFSMTKGDASAKESLKKVLSKDSYNKFDKWSTFVSTTREKLKGKEESGLRTFAQSVTESAPFASPALDVATGGRYSASKLARQQLESEGEYKTSTTAKVLGTGVGLLGGYGLYGKIADTAILSNKSLQATSATAKFQNAMRESYARNPFLFNFTSNSAQEAVEYGVRKGLGDEDYSVSDLVLGVTAGAVFSKVFGKKLDSVFDNVTSRDVEKINEAVRVAKEKMPDMGDKDLFQTISSVKLGNGMTFGELKDSFVKAGGKISENISGNVDAVTNYFRNAGVNTTRNAGRQISNFLTEINSRIQKTKEDAIDGVDIRGFKSEVLEDLMGRTSLTSDDVANVIKEKSASYGITLPKSNTKLDIFDEAEEVVLRGDAQIDNLANPKTVDGFMYQYMNTKTLDTVKLRELDDSIQMLKQETPTLKRLQTIEEKKIKIQEALKEGGFKSLEEAEIARYRIDEGKIKDIAKANRKPGVKGRITNAEKQIVLRKMIDETIALENEVAKIMNKFSQLKSVNEEGEFMKIVQFTQLKNAIEDGDYRQALKSFINTNKPLISKKGLSANPYWVKVKELSTLRAKADVNEITNEAARQEGGMFRLSKDEDRDFIPKLFNFITPGLGDRKRGSSILAEVDTPRNVFERVFGENSFLTRILHTEISSARGRWVLESDKMKGELVKMIDRAGLRDEQLQRKFMIYMTARQGGVSNRITGANNIWIDDSSGKIYDDLYDVKGIEPTRPNSARKLTDDDIARISKEIESNRKISPIVTFLSNKFNDVASRLNRMHYNDTGVLIANEDSYFPVIYKNANYFKAGEEPRNSMTEIFNTSVQKGFLNARKDVPNDFDYNLDLAVMIRHFEDNQLYYLHMKEPILRAKRAVRNSNKRGVNFDELDEGVYYNRDKKRFEWKELDKSEIVEGKPVMSPMLRKYVDSYIEHIEHRGVLNQSGSIPMLAKGFSQLSTWTTISANVWSMISQVFSYGDVIARLGVTNIDKMGKGIFASLTQRSKPAIKYSGVLRERMTEHTRGLALGKIFNIGDLQAISQSKWTQGISDRALEISLRGMRKMDGEVSYGVWMTYAQDFLAKNRDEFPDVKMTSDMDYLNEVMPPVWFKRMIDYADIEMNRVMGSTSDFTMTSEMARANPSSYRVATAIQRTFINRLLYLNHELTNKGAKAIPSVVIALGAVEFMELEREYIRTMYDVGTGKKELQTLDKDLDFGIFTVKADSHFGKMIANNPSLTYDTFETKAYDSIMKKATGKEELTPGQVIAARAMGRFFANNMWNPMSRYELTSQLAGYDKIKNRNEKGEIAPGIRNDLEIGYAITKMVLPGVGDDMIPLAHKIIFEEPLWQFMEDNYQLGKLTKGKPELMEELNTQTFSQQSEVAGREREYYEASKEVQKEKATRASIINQRAQQILDNAGVQKMGEDELINYIVDNPSSIEGLNDDELEKLLDKVAIGKPDVSTDIYAPYRRTTTDTKVIYDKFLKEYIDSGDIEGFISQMDELEAQDVIKSREGFEKKVLKFIEGE